MALVKVSRRGDILVGGLDVETDRLRAPLTSLGDSGELEMPEGWLDNERLLFSAERDGVPAVYAEALTGGEAELIGRRGPSTHFVGQSWSGESVAWRTEPSDAAAECSLVQMDRAGERALFSVPRGGDTVVTCGSQVECARRSGPRRCFAFEVDQGGSTWSLFDWSTGRKGATVFHAPERVFSWGLSPSGDTIAFTNETGSSVNFVAVDSGEVRRGAPTATLVLKHIAFAPSGRSLLLTAFEKAETTTFTLVASDPGGGHLQVLASGPGWLNYPFISPDGAHVATRRVRFEHTLWMLRTDGGAMTSGAARSARVVSIGSEPSPGRPCHGLARDGSARAYGGGRFDSNATRHANCFETGHA